MEILWVRIHRESIVRIHRENIVGEASIRRGNVVGENSP